MAEKEPWWKNIWEMLEFASVASHGLAIAGSALGIKVPEFDVDKESKSIKRTDGGESREGGTDSLDDERYFQELIDKMQPGRRNFFVGWKTFAYPTKHSERKKRVQARGAFEEFRMMVCGMDRHPKKVGSVTRTETERVGNKTVTEKTVTDKFDSPRSRATKYLNNLADRLKTAYENEIQTLGHTPNAEERTVCLQAAFKLITDENRARGVPSMPLEGEKHWTDRATAALNFTKLKAADTTDWSKQKLDRAARVARAQNYLVYRKQRARRQQQTGKGFKKAIARLPERIIRSF